MSTFTENYNLIKPDEEDYYDVQDFNENFDTIDTQLAQTAALAEEVGEKIGSPEDTGNNTVFGKLNAGGSLIKSIQTIDMEISFNGNTFTAEINPVNPARCIVIPHRLFDNGAAYFRRTYTLSANSISVKTENKSNYTAAMRYQIIEFY